jgi:uncharacterized RDD family membrane protein YckC
VTDVIPLFAYCVVAEASRWQGTIGKRAMKLQVSTPQGGRPGIGRVLARNLVKFVPWQFAHMALFHEFAVNWEGGPLADALVIVAAILIPAWLAPVALRKDHRGFHDLLAGTQVVGR